MCVCVCVFVCVCVCVCMYVCMRGITPFDMALPDGPPVEGQSHALADCLYALMPYRLVHEAVKLVTVAASRWHAENRTHQITSRSHIVLFFNLAARAWAGYHRNNQLRGSGGGKG